LKDIAARAGVSAMTVSRVLNQHAHVSEVVRARVLQLVKEYDYQPNFIARSLVSRRSRTVGFLVPAINLSYFFEIIRGIETVFGRNGYHLILGHTGEDAARERAELGVLRSRQVDGLIIAPALNVNDIEPYLALQKLELPAVFVDRCFPGLECSYVYSNDQAGGRLVGELLLRLGHRRIAFLAAALRDPEYCRMKSCRDFLEAAGVKTDRRLVRLAGVTRADGYREAGHLLGLAAPPTAVFAHNDEVAIGVYQRAREMKIRIPGDLTVIGYGNLHWSGYVDPPLTTVDQKPFGIGSEAARVLLERIEKRGTRPTRILVEPELITRGSHAACQPRR